MRNTNFQIQITDEDIEWVKTIMSDIELDDCRISILKNMSSIDIHACPGSGKTTLLIAKLAILSRKWEYSNRGICVLSHTNVAREEIQERLGKLDVGKKLLSYPHFIGTFQSFFDTFITMPYLRSYKIPVNTIDTDYVTDRRWNSIRARQWLERNRKNKSVCDPILLPYELDIKCGKDTTTYKSVRKAIADSRNRGEFTFREMELYAKKGIEVNPIISEIMQERFPILFIDEAQDTKKEIWELIEMLYENSANGSFYQAYGDGNQAIFNSYEKMDEQDKFPRPCALEMLNSKRFSSKIAHLANGVALDKRQMSGDCDCFEKKDIKHTIFLFGHDAEQAVIDKFAELIFDSFSSQELEQYKKYGCHVLGMVHKLNENPEDGEIAERVSNYYADYNPAMKKNIPSTLVDYFWLADEQMNNKEEFAVKVEIISKGIYKLIKKYPLQDINNSSAAFKAIMKTIRPEAKNGIRSRLFDLLHKEWKTEEKWKLVVDEILEIFSEYIDCTKAKGDSFLEWHGRNFRPKESEEDKLINKKQYQNDKNDKIEIEFGSIHSSKGRTHLATLVVETKYHEYNLTSILLWLSGKSKKLAIRNRDRLKCHYVAMTRAKGLLCLAIPQNNLTEEDKKNLQEYGWNLQEVN